MSSDSESEPGHVDSFGAVAVVTSGRNGVECPESDSEVAWQVDCESGADKGVRWQW